MIDERSVIIRINAQKLKRQTPRIVALLLNTRSCALPSTAQLQTTEYGIGSISVCAKLRQPYLHNARQDPSPQIQASALPIDLCEEVSDL